MVTSYLIWWFLTQIKRDKPSFSLSLSQAEFNKVYLKINYDQTSSLNVHIVLIWQEEEFEFGLQLKFKGRLYYKKCQEIVYIMNNHEKTPTHTRWRSKYRNIVVIKLNCKCSEQCEGVFWSVLSTWSAPYNLTNLKNYHAKYSNNEKGEIFYWIYFLFLILSALCLLLRNVSILYTVMELLNIFLQAHRRTWQNNK